MKKLHNIYINQKNAILVIVDVENEFCSPGGKLYNRTIASVMPGVFSAIQKLIEKARKSHIPIIYIQSMRTLKEPSFTVFKQRPLLKKDTWASEICEEVRPQKGDIVIPKYSHDPFFKDDLDNVLKELITDPTQYYAIITGGQSNVCVYHAAMGFHLRDYWTVVPVDGIYYASNEANQIAIDQFSMPGAYSNIFLSRSDLIEITHDPQLLGKRPEPNT